MKQRGRWTLVLLAAVLIAAAIYVSTARRGDRPAGAGELLYPGLEASLDDVTTIRIKGPGDATVVTLQRAETGWHVAERSDFAADSSRVRTLLLGLAQARTIEEKSSLPANYPSLGVEDLTAPDATGTGVELDGLANPVSLIVGKSTGARSTFVRRMGEAASWQVGTTLTLERDPAKWLATELLDIGADRIQSVELTIQGKRPWIAAKASRADLNFKVSGKPAGGSDSAADSSADRVATALAGLRLVDVRPAADSREKPAASAIYRTFDGLVLTIDGYTEGDKHHVRVRPSMDETASRRYFATSSAPAHKDGAAEPLPAEPTAGAAPEPGETPEARAPESVLAQTRAEVAKLETRLEGWAFEIPSWSYDAIFAQGKIGSEPNSRR
jgi:hypothetical protein